jgi:signal transduction histidine kinase
MTQEIDWIARSGARAKGGRPAFFDEMAATRERLDTVERLLEAQGSLSRDAIENFKPDMGAGEERGIAMRAYIARVMRGFQQEVEAMENPDPPVTDWVERLSRG